MSAFKTSAAAVVAVLVCAGSALAQAPDEEPGGWGQAPQLLNALDTDGDGEISAAEIASASESLTALDADGDGSVGVDELMPRQSRSMGRRAFVGGVAAGRGFSAGRRFGPGRGFGGFVGGRGGRHLARFGRRGFAGGGLWTSRPGFRGGRHWSGGFRAGRFGGRGRAARPAGPAGGQGAERGDWGEARDAMRERMLDGLFSRFDADGVGYLSAEQLPEMLWERLSRADADGNGQVTRAELEAHQESMGGRGRGRFEQPDQQPDDQQPERPSNQ